MSTAEVAHPQTAAAPVVTPTPTPVVIAAVPIAAAPVATPAPVSVPVVSTAAVAPSDPHAAAAVAAHAGADAARPRRSSMLTVEQQACMSLLSIVSRFTHGMC
jgi:hypothetical protein